MESSHVTGRVSKEDGESIIIPFDEILDGLQKDIPEGFTTTEMSEKTGMSLPLCRAKIKALGVQGKLEFAGNKGVRAIDGKMRPVPCYRLVNDEK